MVELTNAQEEILGSLRQAVQDNNSQEVKNIFDNNEHNNIQAVLSHEGTLTSDKGTILNDVIDCSNASVSTKVKIIELIWKEADQKTRDFLCCCTIDNFRRFGSYNIPALKTVIQEMEEHKRVMDYVNNFHVVCTSLDSNGNINWKHIEEAFDYGDDQEKVFTRLVGQSSKSMSSN